MKKMGSRVGSSRVGSSSKMIDSRSSSKIVE